MGCGAPAPWGVPGHFGRLIWSGKLDRSLEEKEEAEGGGQRARPGTQQAFGSGWWSLAAGSRRL